MNSIIIVVLLQGIIFGGFCAFIAKEKNRDSFGWFLLGFLFSFIALLALIAVPKLEKINTKKFEEKPKPDWYYKPVKRISRKQKAFRLLLILLGISAFLIIAIFLGK